MSTQYLAGDFPAGTELAESSDGLVLLLPAKGFVISRDRVVVGDEVTSAEKVTEENKAAVMPKLGWGAAGLVALGPLGALAGLILGGRHTEVCVLVHLRSGKKFMG